MPLPREYLSHNQIKVYNECPQKYYFSYVAEIPSVVSDKIFLGEIFHSTIEHFFNSQINRSPLDHETVLNFFQETFASRQKEKEVRWTTAKHATQNRGEAFVRFFLKEIAPNAKPLMVEKELETVIPESNIKLKGIIDLIEEDFAITDFKTTTNKWPENRIPNLLQMIIYKYLFEQVFGNVNSRLKFEVIYSKNSSSIKHQTIPVSPQPKDVSDMLGVVQHVANKIRSGIFDRNQGSRCSYCDYLSQCQTRSTVVF